MDEDFSNMLQSAGPVMIDLMGLSVDAEEHELLQHPQVGGVILFARNYESPAQLSNLCNSIRQIRQSPILIAVDQEGGRVQRFKTGFTLLPSMGEVGQLYQHSSEDGLKWAYCCGWLMAAELLAVGVDLSFAPVLDLDKKYNTVIGDRSFGNNSTIVTILAHSLMSGMHAAGMAATGKHFPGHGSVKADSHLALPIDSRSYADIYQDDMQPFIAMIEANIDALMPAHILFPEIDKQPVGFSSYWLQDVLRKKLGFSGVIFSDDLNMAGAEFAGNYVSRAEAALDAGCDIVLICNNRAGAIEILDHLPTKYILSQDKFNRLKGKYSTDSNSDSSSDLKSLYSSVAWKNQFNLFTNLYTKQRKSYENNA